MSGGARAAVVGAAAWVAGRWVESEADLCAAKTEGVADARLDLGGLGARGSLARAERAAQLAAMVAARALGGASSRADPDRVSVITASTLASAAANEACERRRLQGRRPDPRGFSRTASNAVAGELCAALGARGPTVALVGGPEVGLVALARACAFIRDGPCERAIVAAYERPPVTPCLVGPPGVAPFECAAVVVLEMLASTSRDARLEPTRILVEWAPADAPSALTPLLSVEALARVALAANGAHGHEVARWPRVGAGVRVFVGRSE
jgi:hypothetical protein